MASALRRSFVSVLFALSLVSAIPKPNPIVLPRAGVEPSNFPIPEEAKPSPTPQPIFIGANRNARLAGPAVEVINAAAVPEWEYLGCYTDNEARTLDNGVVIGATNTPDNCIKKCAEFGYGLAGTENSSECFCGSADDIKNTGSKLVAESECNNVCLGDSSRKCGGQWRLSIYKYIGSRPLTKWQRPTGDAAGRYQFLIGAPITALTATLGLNGKVVFLEKARINQYIKNSTGAYELDLSQINNYSRAWKEMHMESDVFCAAGLVLPDKAGRHITLGGWSNDAARGLRLYWPDGSAGVKGPNDWEENYQEVGIQVRRWYGTAMLMANGSVLVAGGQNGPGGDPTPSLELVPRVGPPVDLPFLRRTNPNNLYPFLTQLQGGGIFIGYLNEARVLDEKTFAVRKELPNMPGLVGKMGGRVYPYSGAFSTLPIRFPYTEPTTVLVCGGSTPDGQQGIDNCITSQPESSNPAWTIERSPSPRVMPLLVALPDGTFLILGGAKKGVGGFATSEQPNLKAELYDPRKPVGQRFSVMASTIVARLYHSEAILLQDGRVLVSGSDPEDARYPQEFRIEVFLPPYLLGGKPRPVIQEVGDKNWAYTELVKVVFKVSNANANIKASLVAAEHSTHGVNMNQRIVFPEIRDCTGTLTKTCTVVAPPNGKIAFGWFQLFILENDVPSTTSVWVRIGKDPARIGNWPPFADFKKPGV